MTKGMSAAGAIVVLLLVSMRVEEGGAIDSIARNSEGENIASADVESGRETASDVIVAKAKAPPMEGPERDDWSWFMDAGDEVQVLPSPPGPQPAQPVTITGNGELDRDRMNLE